MPPQHTHVVTIYGLSAPASAEVRYIGQTSAGLKQRLYQHICVARAGRRASAVDCWIRALLAESLRPAIEALALCPEDDANALEAHYIARYLAQGAALVNTMRHASNYSWLRHQQQPRRSVAERFWAKVRKTDGCWLWIGSCNPAGYGMLRVEGRAVKAHRLAYEMANGPIPKGLDCCHSCDNPSCVRPDHLWVGTRAQNLADMARKKRGWSNPRGPVVRVERRARGERHGGARLSAQQVMQIRCQYAAGGVTMTQLGQTFGVHKGHIRGIVRGLRWRHLL